MGEASNPGPKLLIQTANVTSLLPHLPYIASLSGDVVALQEVRLTVDSQKVATEELKVRGWSVVWGKPQPIRPGTVKSVMDAKQGGVGVAFRSCHAAVPSPRSSVGDALYETGRWQSISVKVHKSSEIVHVVSAYGFPRANEGGEVMLENENFIEQVFLEAESLGSGSVIICGDFNVKVENSHMLASAIASGVWTDAAEMVARATDTQAQPTYFTPQGICSRIDMCFLNQGATRMLTNCEVLAVPTEGIKRHKPVQIELDFGLKKEFALKVGKIRGLPKVQSTMSQEELDDLAQTKVEAREEDFYIAVAKRDIDAVWALWCSIAEDYLVERAAVEACEPKVIGDKRYYGRGFASATQKVRIGRVTDKDLNMVPDEDRRVLHKLLNLLRELPTSPRKDLLWNKIRRVGTNVLTTRNFSKMWELPSPPAGELIVKLTEDVALVLKKVVWGDRERLLQNWKKRKVEKGTDSFGDVARHFRDPDQTPLTILKTPTGRITGRVDEMDQILRDNWLPIFAKHSDPVKCPPPSVDWFMTRYAEFIPVVEQKLEQLTVTDLQRTIGKLSTEGAGGLDGWTPKDFKKLHPLILELLLMVYDVVEETGLWPEPLCWAGVTLIPKGEGGAPLDQRPITVTPIAYRIWAAARMQQCTSWQELWIQDTQHGARAKHSTVNALVRLSIFFEQAYLDGVPAHGIAIDLSKAFDNIPIDIVFAVCKKMGMDESLWRGLRGMYTLIHRRFNVA